MPETRPDRGPAGPVYELRHLIALLERQEAERKEKDRKFDYPVTRAGGPDQ